jgi:hypothetical protein
MNHAVTQVESIVLKNKLSEDYINEYYIGRYILLRWLSFIESNDLNYLRFINELNKIPIVSDISYNDYILIYTIFPKIPNFNIEYIKRLKDVKTESQLNQEKLLKTIANDLEISSRDAINTIKTTNLKDYYYE